MPPEQMACAIRSSKKVRRRRPVPRRMPAICAATESPPNERKQEARQSPNGCPLASRQPLVTSSEPSSRQESTPPSRVEERMSDNALKRMTKPHICPSADTAWLTDRTKAWLIGMKSDARWAGRGSQSIRRC